MSQQQPPRVVADLARGESDRARALEAGHSWAKTGLLPHHVSYLRQRGVSAYVASIRGYVSVGEGTGFSDVLPTGATGWSPEQEALILGRAELPVEADAPRKPGRPSKTAVRAAAARKKNRTSLLLPFFSGVGGKRTPVIWQARPDHPRLDADDRPLKFEQPAGADRGSEPGQIPVDVHPRVMDLVWEHHERGEWSGTTPILLTEGVLKSDAVHTSAIVEGIDLAPVAVSGVTMPYIAPVSADNPDSPNHGDEPILSDAMLDLPWAGRVVYLCWDADWQFNRGVYRPLLTTARLLEEEGAEVYVLSVPVVGGDHKSGVDDYLATQRKSGSRTPLTDLLNTAISVEEAAFLVTEYTRDDIGRSDRLAAHAHRYDLGVYSTTHKSWMQYDPALGIWSVDTSGNAIQEAAKALTQLDLYRDGTGDTRTANAVTNTVRMARSHPLLQVTAADFDLNAVELLNVANGIVDLRTGNLLPHDPARRFTRVAPAEFDPDALRRHQQGESWEDIAPTFMSALDFIFYGDAELIRTMQRSLGMSLLGKVAGGPGMAWWVSGGSSGKSTLTTILFELLGLDEYTGYATLLDHTALTKESTPETRATLFGKRLLVFQEFPQGARLSDGDLKKLTSDDPIKARYLYGNPFSFLPTHNTIAATNYLPRVSTTEVGTWRRLKRVDFPRTITESEKDPNLPARLQSEYPQILAWLVQGCMDFLSDGAYWSAAILDATERWRTSGDLLSAVLSCVEVDPGSTSRGVSDDDLFQIYRSFVDDPDSGYRSRAAFVRALEVHQDFPRRDAGRSESARRVSFKNLRLTATGEERLAQARY